MASRIAMGGFMLLGFAPVACNQNDPMLEQGDVTVYPETIDELLVNPGMGFADFHMGWWCNLPPVTFTPEECAARVLANWPENYPQGGTAYFRWHWHDVEPIRGALDVDLIDTTIQSAHLLGETFAIRVMVIEVDGNGLPSFMRAGGSYEVAGFYPGGGSTFWPDVRDPVFQAEHARFVQALAARYDGHPAIDSIDIGSVGCWGEWNTACLTGVGDIIEVYSPVSEAERDEIATAYLQLIQHFTDAFKETPVVMLGIGDGGGRNAQIMAGAMQKGAGWRVDCWGDWDIFSPTWSHQTDAYPQMIQQVGSVYPGFEEQWKLAPVELEVCSTIPDWYDRGYSISEPDGEVFKTFQWAVEQHASVLNAKFTPIPADYVPLVDTLLRQNGYRYVVTRLNHPSVVSPGGRLRLASSWQNSGVAPIYLRRILQFRLRGPGGMVTLPSDFDFRGFLPGSTDVIVESTLPAGLATGTYAIEVAVLDRPGVAPDTAPLEPLQLADAGRRPDGWYPLSTVEVRP